MTTDEFKLRIMNKANSLIDQCFSRETISERFINATLKIILKNNIGKVDSVITLFKNENGEIDSNAIINDYATCMGDNVVRINVRDYISNEAIKSFVPDKTLTLTKDDLFEIINGTLNN